MEVLWHVENDSLERTRKLRSRIPPGSDIDRRFGYWVHGPMGCFQIVSDGMPLFPIPETMSSSSICWTRVRIPYLVIRLIEFIELARAESRYLPITMPIVHDESNLEIDIRLTHDRKVHIIARGKGSHLIIDEDEFLGGIDAFIRDFATCMRTVAPELLEWESYRPIRRYVVDE